MGTSVKSNVPFLHLTFTQLGVRENLGRSDCIILLAAEHEETAEQMRSQMNYDVVVYVSGQASTTLAASLRGSDQSRLLFILSLPSRSMIPTALWVVIYALHRMSPVSM